MEAPSPIRRAAVYNVPSPTNAQGEESNTPKVRFCLPDIRILTIIIIHNAFEWRVGGVQDVVLLNVLGLP